MPERLNAWGAAQEPIGGERILPFKKGNNRGKDREISRLRCQNGTSKMGRGGSRYLPYALTEQGVAILSEVLTCPRAIRVNIEIMRAFVRLRQLLASHEELAQRLEELERHLRDHDEQIQAIFNAIRQLMIKPDRPRK